MKQAIYILFLLVFGLLDCAKAQFKDNSNTDRATFTLLLSNMTEGQIAIQTSLYNWESDTQMTKSITLDLSGYNLTNSTGTGFSCTLTDGKWFALKNSTGSGVFTGRIKFGGANSVLKVLTSDVLGAGFSIDDTGASGKIEIGDGTTTMTQSIRTSQCNGRVSLITITSGATLIVSL